MKTRRARGLSQVDLSESGVSHGYISQIEAGASQPSMKALRKLAAKLDVSPHWLETGRRDPLEAAVERIAELEEALREAHRKIKALERDLKRELEPVLRDIDGLDQEILRGVGEAAERVERASAGRAKIVGVSHEDSA